MKMRLVLLVSLGLALVSGPAQAQSALDKYLKKNTQGATASKGDANINKVYQDPNGFWRLDDNRANGGSCSVTYVSGEKYVGFIGPSSGSPASLVVFAAPTIPPEKATKKLKMSLFTASEGKTRDTQALLSPNIAKENVGIILMGLSGIKAAIDELSDVEDVNIVIDKKQVFALKWQGGHKARAAMQACLSGPVGTPQATSNIAANASEGRSTITGTAYAKVALIAPRQYAPKGWDVGLIHMTDELKLWMRDAEARAARGESVEMPEKLKPFSRVTKIEDNKGNFRFTNLPPGDYVLKVSFSYKLDRMTSVDTGYDRCQYDQCSGVSVGLVKTFNEAADIIKEVRISNNGDTVKMDLDKRYVIRQGTLGRNN